jgi:hypothetical protein
MVPHTQTLKLQSSSSKSAAFEQLWFGRTPHLCCAKQREGSKGLIEAAEVIHLKQAQFEDCEAKSQMHLLRLA